MRISKNRDQLIHWAIQEPNEFFVFKARYLAQNDTWITFSQLYHEEKLIATHFNLPLHFFKNQTFQKIGESITFKAKASFYIQKGTKRGTLKEIKLEKR
jgi:hypothetical protein